ncbi:helix-turn-helix domain-containing protein [Flagellimonas sp. CMM7]|uniref:AraC family transcriptional regulator n=1 Tax=Flagellimonas sp. CMM7 TaxID=2654676 RepID=UPI0013D4988F|nr:helix-turn-helix domain-containing protein [Flagellimonas sp. CMM7]UII79418.1 helix-turn-helix domain-containing protein [Flagellimonas sp. CMM7]
MNYQTFQPHPDLSAIVNFYWTLEVPFDVNNSKQKIIPDGFIEMTFNLGDKIKRYTSDSEFILHPCAMVMGQRTKSYYIEPTGDVNSFAICFYPYGFSNFVDTPLKNLVDKEIPLKDLLGEIAAKELEKKIVNASNKQQRIKIVESFLLNKLNEETTIENIVKTTVDALYLANGNVPIKDILKEDLSKRRQLERKFAKQIGVSPKQLGKVIRLQTALKMLLNNETESLTNIAYKSEYYDQAHFIKDFKEFTGVKPTAFLGNENMALSTLFYK